VNDYSHQTVITLQPGHCRGMCKLLTARVGAVLRETVDLVQASSDRSLHSHAAAAVVGLPPSR